MKHEINGKEMEAVEIDFFLHKETAPGAAHFGAILVSQDETDANAEQIWLPKSEIEFETTKKAGIIRVTLPVWLAEKNGLV